MCPCHLHWDTDKTHIFQCLVHRIEEGVYLEPAAFIFFKLNETFCNQQKTICFLKRPCLWKDGVQGHRWRRFHCCQKQADLWTKNLILILTPAILAHSYRRYGEGGEREGQASNASLYTTTKNSFSGGDHEKTSLRPITTERVFLCSLFHFTSKSHVVKKPNYFM